MTMVYVDMYTIKRYICLIMVQISLLEKHTRTMYTPVKDYMDYMQMICTLKWQISYTGFLQK